MAQWVIGWGENSTRSVQPGLTSQQNTMLLTLRLYSWLEMLSSMTLFVISWCRRLVGESCRQLGLCLDRELAPEGTHTAASVCLLSDHAGALPLNRFCVPVQRNADLSPSWNIHLIPSPVINTFMFCFMAVVLLLDGDVRCGVSDHQGRVEILKTECHVSLAEHASDGL